MPIVEAEVVQTRLNAIPGVLERVCVVDMGNLHFGK